MTSLTSRHCWYCVENILSVGGDAEQSVGNNGLKLNYIVPRIKMCWKHWEKCFLAENKWLKITRKFPSFCSEKNFHLVKMSRKRVFFFVKVFSEIILANKKRLRNKTELRRVRTFDWNARIWSFNVELFNKLRLAINSQWMSRLDFNDAWNLAERREWKNCKITSVMMQFAMSGRKSMLMFIFVTTNDDFQFIFRSNRRSWSYSFNVTNNFTMGKKNQF